MLFSFTEMWYSLRGSLSYSPLYSTSDSMNLEQY